MCVYIYIYIYIHIHTTHQESMWDRFEPLWQARALDIIVYMVLCLLITTSSTNMYYVFFRFETLLMLQLLTISVSGDCYDYYYTITEIIR